MPVWRVKNFANRAEKTGDIYTAIDYYNIYVQARPNNLNAAFKLAELYRKSRDYKNAEFWYKKVYDENPSKFIEAQFYYGLMQKMSGDYEGAKETFLKFRKNAKNLKNSRYYKKLVRNEISGCELAPVLMDSSLKVLITHLGNSINMAHIDYNPVPVDKETMYYSSLKADKVEYYNPYDTTKLLPVRKLYVAKRQNGDWVSIGELPGEVNHERYNTGNGALSPDGTKLYFTRSEKKWDNTMISRIYVCEKVGDEWKNPVKLPEIINDPNYTSTQPSVGLDSKTEQEILYFVSDRPDGKGGLDIYYAEWDKRKKRWKRVKNCGSKINTIADDVTPFYDMETRKLYFSSNGHPGLGGLDIFKATGEKNKWTEPQNFGYPVNSNFDELYYAVSKDRERSFFVSNRDGSIALRSPNCCDDIYEFRWTEYIHIGIEGFVFEKIDTTKTDTLREFFTSFKDSLDVEEDNIEALTKNDTLLLNDSYLSLYLIEKTEEGTEEFFIKRIKTDGRANYFFDVEQGNDYKIVAECDGYFNNQFIFTTKTITSSDTIHQPVELKRIPITAIVLNNIYYEFDKATLTDEAKTTIDTTILKILRDNPKLIVEISSHTDSKGNDDYNLKLSQKRAESVVKYLIENGIDEKRLIAKGYGETRPIAPNTNPDGSDNPEGRQMNRRTEFKVIGSSDQFSKLNQSGITIIRTNNSDQNEIKIIEPENQE